MKRFGVALAAIGLLAALPLSVQARADDGGGAARSAADQDTADSDTNATRAKRRGKPAAAAGDTTRGMAEAPAVLQAAGIRCAVSEASWLGQSKPPKGQLPVTGYEVACSDGPGYYLLVRADKTLESAFECLQLRDAAAAAVKAGTPVANALACKLPGNATPEAGLFKALAPLAPGCTPDAARWLGAKPSKENIYEIGCSNRAGAILQVAPPGATGEPLISPCEKLTEGSGLVCELTTAEERLAGAQALVAKSDRACTVTTSRFVGGSTSGSKEDFYEIKCGDGAGYMLVTDQTTNGYKRTVGCAQAMKIGDGCTLTDAVEVQNAEAATYKGLATTAGFNCDVDQYRLLGMETGTKREVVELHCKNQTEGLIAFFPAGAGETDFYDCSKVGSRKLSCSLTKPDAVYPRLVKDVTSKGKSCEVTGFRSAGVAQAGKTEFVEVSCATGPGLMVEYATGTAPFAPATGVFTCAEAVNIGGGCKLGTPAGRT